MERNNSRLFVNAPNTLLNNYKEKLDTAKAEFHAKAGTIDCVEDTEEDVLNKIRQLLMILPSNNEDDNSFDECIDDLNRLVPQFESDVKDPAKALADISDEQYFFEIKSDFAQDMVTAFIRLNGMTIGTVANRLELLDSEGKTVKKFDGTLSSDGCEIGRAHV